MRQLTVRDMHAASVSYGIETTAAALDDGDDEEKGRGGGQVIDEQEHLKENEELKLLGTPYQEEAASVDVQQDGADRGEYHRLCD